MGTKITTGLSKGRESAVVAREAVRIAKEKLGNRKIDLSIVYCSSDYDCREVVDAVREATHSAPLIGASSSGEFTEEKVEKGSIAVGLVSSDEFKCFTALSEGVKEDPETTIREVIAKLPDNVEGYPYLTAILLLDGLCGMGEEVALLASYLFNKEVKIVGGMASNDFKMEETFVFCGDRVSPNAISVCLFASKMPLFTGIKHGHTPLSRPLRVTRAQGNVIYEIDNRPAWSVWKEETTEAARQRGMDVEQIKTPGEIAQFFTNYILGLITVEGEYKIRWPVSVNDDGSLNFTCTIPEGAVFRIMDGSDVEKQINATKEAAEMAKKSAENAGYVEFAGLLVFDCAVRQLMLGNRFREAVDCLKTVLPAVPLLGWETYGEIRLEDGQFSGFHNATSVVLLVPRGVK